MVNQDADHTWQSPHQHNQHDSSGAVEHPIDSGSCVSWGWLGWLRRFDILNVSVLHLGLAIHQACLSLVCTHNTVEELAHSGKGRILQVAPPKSPCWCKRYPRNWDAPQARIVFEETESWALAADGQGETARFGEHRYTNSLVCSSLSCLLPLYP